MSNLEENIKVQNKGVSNFVFEQLFNNEKISITGISLISLFVFYIYSTIYSLFVFVQFETIGILSVSLLFFILQFFLATFFSKDLFKDINIISPVNFFWAFFIFAFLIALLYSPNPEFFNYYRTFPLLEAELGLGWHQDSSFHASIIHSINNLGVPSIGQHDTPILFYHVLSHYIDALIIKISGVDLWQSYGLFYFYKSVLLISSILVFVAVVTKGYKFYLFFLSLVFFTPVVISEWYAVGSHGLWFTSLLVIYTAPAVFKIMTKESSLKAFEYIFLFFVFVFISLGKVSSGFMYSILVGVFILLNHYKRIGVYVFGCSLLAFFALFTYLMGGANEGKNTLFKFIYIKGLGELYIIIFMLGMLGWLFRARQVAYLCISIIISIFVLFVIVGLKQDFTRSDIGYFVYGLYSCLFLISYQLVVRVFYGLEIRSFSKRALSSSKINKLFIATCFFGVTKLLDLTDFNIFNVNSESFSKISYNFHQQPFLAINSIDEGSSFNLYGMLYDREQIKINESKRILKNFDTSLKEFINNRDFKTNKLLMYISKDIFEKDFEKFGGISWARGMLIYAVTGVPLIHGLESLRGTYGIADYDNSALWVSRDKFDGNAACQFKKAIVIVEDFNKPKFSYLLCGED